MKRAVFSPGWSLTIVLFLFCFLSGCALSPGGEEYVVPLPPSGVGFVEPGDANLLYVGYVLTPAGILTGEMLVDGSGRILYIGTDSSAHPEAVSATRLVCAYGLAVPGLVDAWRHMSYAGAHPVDTAGERYDHRHEWRHGLNGHTEINIGGENEPRLDELALVVAGTTSAAGSVSGDVTGMVRNLANAAATEGLFEVGESVRLATFPLDDSNGYLTTDPTTYADYPADPDGLTSMAYSAILAEGIGAEARCEFLAVSGSGRISWDILSPKTSVVHGIALLPQDLQQLAQAGSSLIWTPRSDLLLYGGTAAVTVAARLGCNIALGSTWTATGSPNLLEELKTARFFNRQYLHGFFSDQELLQMATLNAARAYHVQDRIGTLEPGKLADFVVFDVREHSGYDAVFEAGLADVALVFRGGLALYGDTYLVDDIRDSLAGSETFWVEGAQKRLYTVEQFGLTLGELSETGLFPVFYSADDIVTQLVPQRPGEYDGARTLEDYDGDGLDDDVDNAPEVFNPPRPVDGGLQGDQDGDGIGDVSDATPLG